MLSQSPMRVAPYGNNENYPTGTSKHTTRSRAREPHLESLMAAKKVDQSRMDWPSDLTKGHAHAEPIKATPGTPRRVARTRGSKRAREPIQTHQDAGNENGCLTATTPIPGEERGERHRPKKVPMSTPDPCTQDSYPNRATPGSTIITQSEEIDRIRVSLAPPIPIGIHIPGKGHVQKLQSFCAKLQAWILPLSGPLAHAVRRSADGAKEAELIDLVEGLNMAEGRLDSMLTAHLIMTDETLLPSIL